MPKKRHKVRENQRRFKEEIAARKPDTVKTINITIRDTVKEGKTNIYNSSFKLGKKLPGSFESNSR